MTKKPFLSVVVPTHEMDDRSYFFKRLLNSLWNQSYQDFEIVVTDNSEDDVIEKICDWYKTGIRYIRNPKKGMAPNTNEAIKQAKGDYIKILYMDDALAHDDVLERIVEKFKKEPEKLWLVSGANNNSNPHWTEDIHLGNNKLGSPSALAFRNKSPLLFDESLTWLLDVELYVRMYKKFGEPIIMSGKHIDIGIGLHQMTNLISEERKSSEHEYLIKKYG